MVQLHQYKLLQFINHGYQILMLSLGSCGPGIIPTKIIFLFYNDPFEVNFVQLNIMHQLNHKHVRRAGTNQHLINEMH